MDELLAQDKLQLKRLDSSIKRLSESGIILIGVDTQKLSDSFTDYLLSEHKLLKLNPTNELLKTIAFDKTIDKTKILLTDIFNHQEQEEIVEHLQFQRDYIYENNIKIVLILSNEMFNLLQAKGDLFSTAKYAHTFFDHSVDNNFEEKNEKLTKAIENYKNYLKEDIKYNSTLAILCVTILHEAYQISDYPTAIEYANLTLNYSQDINLKAEVYSELGNIYNELSEYDKSIKYSNKLLKIAKKYNLPDRVIDFIRTHHGTSLVYYFYMKEKAANDNVDINDFAYPGPTPYSKETAILMMCDSVEAASKSLKEPTSTKINDFVENIINKQMESGQFLNADITFKEIQSLKKVLKFKLANIYHLRIEYPE